MLVKYTNGSVNIIDKNDVFVGYDVNASCCEYANIGFSYFKPKSWTEVDADHENFKGIKIQQPQWDSNITFEPDFLVDYEFDPIFIIQNEAGEDDGNMVTFRCTRHKSKNIYLTLFNVHNGYYSHGFSMNYGTDIIYKDHI